MPVEHEALVSVEHPAAGQAGAGLPGRAGGEPDRVGLPGAVILGEGQRGHRLAARDSGQKIALGSVVRAREQRRGGKDGAGQVGPRVQRGAKFLEHDRLFGEGEPGAAVLLGNGDGLQAELAGRVVPDLLVGSVGRVHQLADPLQRHPVREEAPDRIPQLLLLRAVGELHVSVPFCSGWPVTTRTSSASICAPSTHRGLTSTECRQSPSERAASAIRTMILARASRSAGLRPRAPPNTRPPPPPLTTPITPPGPTGSTRRLTSPRTSTQIPPRPPPTT